MEGRTRIEKLIKDLDSRISRYRRELEGGSRNLMPSIYDYYRGKLTECAIIREELKNLNV